jgi:hypothetical protein
MHQKSIKHAAAENGGNRNYCPNQYEFKHVSAPPLMDRFLILI